MSITPAKQTKTAVVTDFRRAQILDAARENFARYGLAGTTVDDIARRAGMAKGTVYLYYRSKDEILRQLLQLDLAQLRDETLPLIDGPGAIEERLGRFLAGALAFFDSKRDYFEHVQIEMSPDVRRRAEQKLALVLKAQVESWRAVLVEAQKAGLVGAVDAEASAIAIVALASGLAKQRVRCGSCTGPVAEIAAKASAALWKGLAAR
jgi:AcrR family transcriptional regulator